MIQVINRCAQRWVSSEIGIRKSEVTREVYRKMIGLGINSRRDRHRQNMGRNVAPSAFVKRRMKTTRHHYARNALGVCGLLFAARIGKAQTHASDLAAYNALIVAPVGALPALALDDGHARPDRRSSCRELRPMALRLRRRHSPQRWSHTIPSPRIVQHIQSRRPVRICRRAVVIARGGRRAECH